MTSVLNGGPLPFGEPWTVHVLQQMVAARTPESQFLEFKGRGYRGPEEHGAADHRPKRNEMAKDVAALANSTGGVLILGVEESEGIAADIKPLTNRSADDEQSWMRQVLARRLTSVPTMVFRPVPWDGGGYVLVVEIPPSPQAPHGVVDPADDTRRISYPVRRGVLTDYLTEPEVASAYNTRLVGRQQRDAVTTQRIDDAMARTSPNGERSAWLWVAAVPAMPRPETIMTTEVVNRLRRWHDLHQMDGIHHGPMSYQRVFLGRVVPGPGFISVHDIQSGHEAGAAYAELWDDGRCYVAGMHDLHDSDARLRLTSTDWLTDQLLVLLDYALRFTLDWAGPLGSITVHAGVNDLPFTQRIDNHKDPATPDLHPPVQLGTEHHGTGFVPKGGTRVVRNPPRVTVTVPASEAQTNRTRAIAAYDVATSLLSHFGSTDTPFLGPEGPIAHPLNGASETWIRNFDLGGGVD